MKIIYFFFFILIMPNIFGFGISPSKFEINLNNDDYAEKGFFILNDKETKSLFNVSSYGLEYFNFTELIIEVDGNSEREVRFMINVPYETVAGIYDGRIYVKEITERNGGVNLENLLGVKINLIVDSDYSETEINTEQKQILKNNFELEKKLEFEIILFYLLIMIIFILCLYKIYINFR